MCSNLHVRELWIIFADLNKIVVSQEGAINSQRCPVENQKDAIAVQGLWL